MPCETMRHQELETPVLRHHVRSCRVRRCPRRWHGAPSRLVGVDRYYDPATGQFLSVDPDVQQTLQAYLYASDDPVNGIDPSGLWCWGLCSFTDAAHDIAHAAHEVAHAVDDFIRHTIRERNGLLFFTIQ